MLVPFKLILSTLLTNHSEDAGHDHGPGTGPSHHCTVIVHGADGSQDQGGRPVLGQQSEEREKDVILSLSRRCMCSQFRAQQRDIMPAAPVDIILSHIML